MGESCLQILDALDFSLWPLYLSLVHIIIVFLLSPFLELRLIDAVQVFLTKHELVNFA